MAATAGQGRTNTTTRLVGQEAPAAIKEKEKRVPSTGKKNEQTPMPYVNSTAA
jgi:hypothetical protein